MNPALPQLGHFLGGSPFALRNDGAGMSHPTTRGRSLTGNGDIWIFSLSENQENTAVFILRVCRVMDIFDDPCRKRRALECRLNAVYHDVRRCRRR